MPADTLSLIIASLSALGAIWAAVVAKDARRDVQKYRDAFFVIRAGEKWVAGGAAFVLENTGDTRAVNVRVEWPWDTTGLHAGGWTWDVIQSHETVDGATITPEVSGMGNHVIFDIPERSRGVVTWTNVLGKTRKQDITLPSTQSVRDAQSRAAQPGHIAE